MERNLTYIALFAALIAALGLVPQITLATGVSITAQSLGVMLCGTVLGARRGALAAWPAAAVGGARRSWGIPVADRRLCAWLSGGGLCRGLGG